MMTVYTPWESLDELYGIVPEPLDDGPLTEEQEVRWNDDGVMYIVEIAEESSEGSSEEEPSEEEYTSEESSDEGSSEEDDENTPEQDWTKTYNFGGTYLGPVFLGNTSFDVQDDEDLDEIEIDYP